MRELLCFLSSALLLASTPAKAEPCRLALVLALDVSGSVNDSEYVQQLSGLAYALDSREVRTSILASLETPVHLAVFEWSSQNHQFIIQPWITLKGHAEIDQVTTRIRAYRKQRAGLKTAMGTALLFSAELLAERRQCWQKTIDVSGDGKNNIGPSPEQVYGLDAFDEITVNALVVGDPASAREAENSMGLTRNELKLYFERNVIHGADSFAMIAHGYEDYARAMQRKLLRELSPPVMGSNESGRRRHSDKETGGS